MGPKDRIVYHGLKQKAKLGYLHPWNTPPIKCIEESKYQQWAEENQWAFGNYYVNIDSGSEIYRKRKVVDLPVQNIRGYMILSN